MTWSTVISGSAVKLRSLHDSDAAAISDGVGDLVRGAAFLRDGDAPRLSLEQPAPEMPLVARGLPSPSPPQPGPLPPYGLGFRGLGFGAQACAFVPFVT